MVLDRKTRFKVFIRSLFVQACWNFESMQSVGFLYTVLPGLEKIYEGDPEGLRDAALRHSEFINTHPYFATHLAAMSLAMEEKVKSGNLEPSTINSSKVGLMGSLGAIGDSFFWGSLKPLSSLLAVLIALINPWAGVLFLIVFYNYFHLRMRIEGFCTAIDSPEGIYTFLKAHDFAGKNEYIRSVVLVFLGVYLGFFISRTLPPNEGFALAGVHFALSLGVIVALEFVYRKIAAVSEIIVFSSLFVLLISLALLGS